MHVDVFMKSVSISLMAKSVLRENANGQLGCCMKVFASKISFWILWRDDSWKSSSLCATTSISSCPCCWLRIEHNQMIEMVITILEYLPKGDTQRNGPSTETVKPWWS